MESNTTLWKPDGRHKDGPKKGHIKWVRYYMSPRPIYRGQYMKHGIAEGLVKRLAARLRISKHRVTKSTHRHQSR